MKISILFYLLSLYNVGNCDNIEKYLKAYKMIQDSSIVYQHFFKCYDPKSVSDSFSICVSNRIYFMSKLFFDTDIIEYEYNNPLPYGELWRHIRDSLIRIEIDLIKKHENDTNYKLLTELQKINENDFCDLKLFFSDFDCQNRLRASLVYNNNIEEYTSAFRESRLMIDYLFYFKDNDIKKVIIKEWFR
jgi:hypothetical protein